MATDATSKFNTKAATAFLLEKYIDLVTSNTQEISLFELKSLRGQCTMYSKHHKPGSDGYDARYSNALKLANTRILSTKE
jgi:hypothetical protein